MVEIGLLVNLYYQGLSMLSRNNSFTQEFHSPKNNKDYLESIKCPLDPNEKLIPYMTGFYNRCGLNDFKFQLYQCPKCEMVINSHTPSNEIYPTSRDEKNNFIGHDSYPWYPILLKRIHKYKKTGELLELGCNNGIFLEMAKKAGFNCLGVEIDQVAASEAQKMSRNVLFGDFTKIDFQNKKYDVIVMNHVLEHIPNILDVPAKLASLLKDDGYIFINVPYYNGTIVKILKENWCQLAPHTHIWFFSKIAIRRLFVHYFKNLLIKSNSHCEPTPFSFKNLKLLLKFLIVHISDCFNSGDELTLILSHPKNKL